MICSAKIEPASANRVIRVTIISDYFYFNRLYAIIYDYLQLLAIIYDYFIAKTQTIILHYCIISKKTIISLISLRLFHLYFSVHIIAIIAIMCIILLKTIIPIILFEMYYDDYMFPSQLYALCTLSRDYVHYIY